MNYTSLAQLVQRAILEKKDISGIVIGDQALQLGLGEEHIIGEMAKNYKVMKESIEEGLSKSQLSYSGLSGTDAVKAKNHTGAKTNLGGRFVSLLIQRALAVGEENARMGRIVAAPTAGSSGVLPAVLMTIEGEYQIDEIKVVKAMFTAGAIGMVIANQAGISGAHGGCQEECGSAAAMAAGAAVELMGGDGDMVINACALALKSFLGLVCDPVSGLVEVPCIKRNVSAAMVALSSAEMALAGVKSFIPADEVIKTMNSIAATMPDSLKETSKGGLAVTETAMAHRKEVLNT